MEYLLLRDYIDMITIQTFFWTNLKKIEANYQNIFGT